MKKIVTIKLNKELYPDTVLNQAMQVFADLCSFDFVEDQIIIHAKSDAIPLDILGLEFYNYMLGLINNQ